MNVLTPEEVARIASIADPVQRNEAITRGYHVLSEAAARLLGKGNANWTTFGVWASQQAGTTIRGEEIPAVIQHALAAVPELAREQARLNELLRRIGLPQLPSVPEILLKLTDVPARLSTAMAGGNQAIFADIGSAFSRFVMAVEGHTQMTFAPGQEQLRDAFAAYRQALSATDAKEKAELMLLGNALIGAHEQQLVQPFIEQTFDAPEPVFREAISGTLLLILGALPCPIRVLVRWRLWRSGLVDALTGLATAIFHRVATELFARFQTPRENLFLGDDLPSPPGLSTPYPADLMRLTQPELVAVIEKFDRAPDTLGGSGTDDWSNYAQRMNFIVELFRSRAQDPCLFDPPFPLDAPDAVSVAEPLAAR